jgi:phosphoadenosine phosphosulfate reductase
MNTQDLDILNKEFASKTPQEIVEWAVKIGGNKTIVSTNFNPHEAGILKLATEVFPDIPVLWADSGYNTPATYRFALELIEKLQLNIKLYVPKRTVALRDAIYGGIPSLEKEKEHAEFTQEVKLEPFKRGLEELKPKVWLTALRRDQTEFRKNMDVVSLGENDLLKVCPILDWNEQQLEEYIQSQDLPIEKNYFDPTKVLSKRECGLHPNF